MIITKTPFRISFIGGGTDIPEYFKKNNGQVLATTINKFSYHLIKFPSYNRKNKFNISYSKINNADNLKNIEHPVIRQVLKKFKLKRIDLHHDSDLSGQNGLGTSSAFCVGLIKSVYELKKIKKNKLELAKEAINIERNILKESGGLQDQICASYGGFNKIIFKKNGKFIVKKIHIKKKILKELQSRILITLIPRKHFSYDHSVANILHKKKIQDQLKKIHKLAIHAEKFLLKGDIKSFAKTISLSWEIKAKFKNTSNQKINTFYSKIKKSSYIDGGKLLGAGGGGYFLLIAKKNCINKLKKFLIKKRLNIITPKFYKTGSQVIFNDHK